MFDPYVPARFEELVGVAAVQDLRSQARPREDVSYGVARLAPEAFVLFIEGLRADRRGMRR